MTLFIFTVTCVILGIEPSDALREKQGITALQNLESAKDHSVCIKEGGNMVVGRGRVNTSIFNFLQM